MTVLSLPSAAKPLDPQRARPRRLGAIVGPWALCVLVFVAAAGTYFSAGEEARLVLQPLLLMVAAAYLAFTVLWFKDGTLPLLDVGLLCLAIVVCYIAIPISMYVLAGLTLSDMSDGRLTAAVHPLPEDFARFVWYGAAFVFGFSLIYALFRGPRAPGPERKATLRPEEVWIIVALVVGLAVALSIIEVVYGVNLSANHEENFDNFLRVDFTRLPHLVAQFAHNFGGMGTIFRIALVVYLVSQYDRRWFRFALFVWLGFEIIGMVSHKGSRTFTVMLLLSAMLAYHRFVRPLGFARMAMLVSALLVGVIAYGYVRDYQLSAGSADWDTLLTTATEFQILLGTPMHIELLLNTGKVESVPWQVYWADLLLLIPQQFLPFQKIDPGEWYLQVVQLDNQGIGFMYGLLSQAVIGWGSTEMAIRGAALAAVLACIHRLYVRNASSFWWTVFYIWLGTVIYYAYRGSSFYWIYFIVFRFLPALLVFKLCVFLWRTLAPARRPEVHAQSRP